MELKRINDPAQRDQDKPGQRKIANFDTQISVETAESLRQVDANIRDAEQKVDQFLVG